MKHHLLFIIFLLLPSLSHSSEFYQCTDASGHITIQQFPCEGMQMEKSLSGDGRVISDINTEENWESGNDWQSWQDLNPQELEMEFKKQLGSAINQESARMGAKGKIITLASVLALIAMIWYTLVIIYIAFKESILWGLIVLFIPFGMLVFVCLHWQETKSPFLISIAAWIICIGVWFLGLI